jgi:hypothetical protein
MNAQVRIARQTRVRPLSKVLFELKRERATLSKLDERAAHHRAQGNIATADYFSDLGAPFERIIVALEQEARTCIALTCDVSWDDIAGAAL